MGVVECRYIPHVTVVVRWWWCGGVSVCMRGCPIGLRKAGGKENKGKMKNRKGEGK